MYCKLLEETTRRLLEIKFPMGFSTFVGILSVSDLAWRYFGPPMATDMMIPEIHALMGVMVISLRKMMRM
ncbi:hypothetical protein FH972_008815 [Carpinus fangiana]|uniref:Uncharacterized protein n=1 Tax=Carpinus fangiana TaxID=176857 RepID=A0A5N6QZT7_9ROSI|nr:hypothetical protein FH972_008815 [Carpinus fangiana]